MAEPSHKSKRVRSPKAPKPGGTRLVRIQKVMAGLGVASRRACEQMVADGMVSVNGTVVLTLPVLVDPLHDRIEIDGRPLPQMTARGERTIHVMLYKPRHTVTTASDPEGRRTVTELVEHPSGVRLYPVGRLDFDTMGLVLLTNDGDLANKLTHPRFGIEKTYRAIVRGVPKGKSRGQSASAVAGSLTMVRIFSRMNSAAVSLARASISRSVKASSIWFRVPLA